ncbi:MAG: hypothetical protein QOE77_458 [Blastocatellia bacterium]|jgi:hypothetical protein|nr:hypothetical protein [Blastocatellia bacterium]
MSANNPAGNAAPSGNVVKTTGPKKCKPFIFEVMVYSPEAGYKAEIVVERGCTATNDSVWKFVFDLYKKKAVGDGFDQLVHVSYRALTQKENAEVVGMIDGLTDAQADALPDLHEAAKEFHDNPTPENKTNVLAKANAVVTAEN